MPRMPDMSGFAGLVARASARRQHGPGAAVSGASAGRQRNLGRGAFGIRAFLGTGPLGICSDCGSALSR